MTASPARRPWRILYVENGIGFGGAVICLRHLVRNLDRSRYRPMVVTGRDEAPYRALADDAPWRTVLDRRIDLGPARRRLESSPRMARHPHLHRLLSQLLARTDDVVNFLPALLGLLMVALRFRPDLIHANNEPLCNRAALIVARLLRVPTICHARGRQEGSRMMRWCYRLPTLLVPVSEWVGEELGRGLGIPPERRPVVYDGVAFDELDPDADGGRFRRRFGIGDEDFTVGLVGLLIPWKGQRLFLEAAERLLAQHPDLRLLIVGGAPEECRDYARELEVQVRAAGLAERVVFTGQVEAMAEVYNGLDVVVSASTAPEPLGTMVIEAMLMGRPLIVPAHGGGAEMVSHGRTGLLFRPGDATALAEAIERFYRAPALRRRLGAAARRHAHATFAVQTHARRIEALYERLLDPAAENPARPRPDTAAGRQP